MNGAITQANGNGAVADPLTEARFLIGFVMQDIEALLGQPRTGDQIRLGEERLRAWISLLSTALRLVRSIPTILIFPPPPQAQLLNRAATILEQVIQALRNIRVASPLIFPPQPGSAAVTPAFLQSVVAMLRQANALILQAQSTGAGVGQTTP